MRGARMIIRYSGVRSLIDQESGDISDVLVHLAGHRILESVRDVRVEFATQRRIPGIVARGPR